MSARLSPVTALFLALLPLLAHGAAAFPDDAASSPPAAGARSPLGAEAKLGPFLRRVAAGSAAVRGRSAVSLPPRSEAVVRSLPPFVRLDRRGEEPALFAKARVEGEPAPGRAARPPVERSLEAIGVEIRARVGDILSLRLPASAIEAVAAMPEVLWVKAAHAYRLQNDVSTGSVHLDSDQVNGALMTGGAGVIVAVIDTGIDWRHPDFRNADGSTRILGIWDQTLSDPLHPPPAGFTFGAHYTRDDIDAALATNGSLLTGDGHGHGSHVAGSAAGNGLDTGQGVPAGTFAGVAPEADLLVVRVFNDAGAFCAECDLTAAVQFIRQVAESEGKPWVGNMSLGTSLGAHDGTDADELAIAAAIGPGRVGAQLAIAAGNSGARRVHWDDGRPPGSLRANSFSVPSYTPASGPDNDVVWLDLWYGGGSLATVEIEAPDGAIISAAAGEASGIVCTTSGAVYVDATSAPDPANGDNRVFVQIWDSSGCAIATPPETGAWWIRVRADDVPPSGAAFDVWNEATVGSGSATFSAFDAAGTVTVPGTARHAMTAGAYVSKDEWLNSAGSVTRAVVSAVVGAASSFSGRGPTRDGRLKPDVAAPGEFVGSTLTGLVGATRGIFFTERDGRHGDIRGTSMATPHVAGTAALALAVNPALDGPEVKAAIQAGARADGFTGSVPNDTYGFGKLRALEASFQAASIVTGVVADPAGGFTAAGSLLVDSYNVYRGTIPGIASDDYGTCFLPGLPAPGFDDPGAPGVGQAFFYLVAGVAGGVEGLLGTDGDGRLRPNNAPCF
ncbi:MAG: S8 family serine peptidase [Acidobacteriota bacterium]